MYPDDETREEIEGDVTYHAPIPVPVIINIEEGKGTLADVIAGLHERIEKLEGDVELLRSEVRSQLFGTMMDVPRTWPHYMHDIQRDLDERSITDDMLPQQDGPVHSEKRGEKASESATETRRVLQLLGESMTTKHRGNLYMSVSLWEKTNRPEMPDEWRQLLLLPDVYEIERIERTMYCGTDSFRLSLLSDAIPEPAIQSASVEIVPFYSSRQNYEAHLERIEFQSWDGKHWCLWNGTSWKSLMNAAPLEEETSNEGVI